MVISENNEVFSVDTIDLNENMNLSIDIPWITGFSTCGVEDILYVYSGNLIKGYNPEKQNLADLFHPKRPRNVLPEKSNQLLKINLTGKSVSSITIPAEAGGNCTSMLSLDKDQTMFLIVSDPNIWLYSPSLTFEPEVCELGEEYGGCKMDMESNIESYECLVPRCSTKVHLKCDSTIRGKPDITKLMCPACRDIDPETGRKRPKIPSGCGRGRPRKN